MKTSENFIFIQAPTGSGKTYTMVQNAIYLASTGKIAILSFHSKNLVNQTEELIYKLLENINIKNREKITVVIHTQTTALTSKQLLQKFMKGSVIFLTVHNYLQAHGDCFIHAPFFLLAYLFSDQIYLFIDEGHLFLEKNDQTMPLTFGFSTIYNSNQVLKSSAPLSYKKFSQSYEISPPSLSLSHVEGAETLYTVQTPEKFSSDSEKIDFFSDYEFQNLSKQNQNQNQNITSQNATAIVHSTVQSQNSLEKKCRETLYLDNFSPNFQISSEISYENPFIICRFLEISQGDRSFKMLQKEFLNRLKTIMEYNVIYTLMKTLNADELITAFNQELKSFLLTGGDINSPELEEKLNCQFLMLQKALQNEFNSLTFKNSNIYKDSYIFDVLFKKIVNFWKNYKFVLLKKQYILEKHILEDPQIAFLIKLMTSSIHEIITVYPIINGEKCKDFETFKNCLLKEQVENYEDEDDAFQNFLKEQSEKDQELQNQQNDKEVESILNIQSFSMDLQEQAENQTFDNSEKLKKKNLIVQSSLPPFTTYLNTFNIWNLYLFKQISNPILYCSATFNTRHLQEVQKEFSENSKFLNQVGNNEKLDKILVVYSNFDYFYSKKNSWKLCWEKFGQKVWENLSKPSLNLKKTECDYALLLLPSEKKASYFFEKCLLQKTKHYTLIKNQTEGIDVLNAKFREDGMLTSKLSCRITSIQSLIGCGLNLPNHPLLLTSLNIFKPIHTLFHHKEFAIQEAQGLDAYYLVKQGIGRIARKSTFERENPNLKTTRVVFISKINKFPQILENLKDDFKDTYNFVKIVNTTEFEQEIVNLFKRSKGIQVFLNIQKEFPEFIQMYFLETLSSAEDFRFLLLQNLIFFLEQAKHKILDFETKFLSNFFF